MKNFNLDYTLNSGQIFSYKEVEPGLFLVNAYGIAFLVKQEGGNLLFKGCSEDFIKKFFSLDSNYNRRIREISKDRFMAKLVKKYNGLRIMKQHPRECAFSFICSSASNIPKIKKNVELLSMKFGRKIKVDKYGTYIFPKKLGSYEEVKACKTGFRAKYLYEADRIFNKRFIDRLECMDYKKARETLLKVPGIGEKIAECICLFSLGYYESFPVDVWIKKIVSKVYLKKDARDATKKEVIKFGRSKFGKNAGLAQQFLYFEAIRNKKHFRQP